MGPPPVPKYCAQEADIVSCVDLLVKNAVHVVTGVLLQFHHYTQTLLALFRVLNFRVVARHGPKHYKLEESKFLMLFSTMRWHASSILMQQRSLDGLIMSILMVNNASLSQT